MNKLLYFTLAQYGNSTKSDNVLLKLDFVQYYYAYYVSLSPQKNILFEFE